MRLLHIVTHSPINHTKVETLLTHNPNLKAHLPPGVNGTLYDIAVCVRGWGVLAPHFSEDALEFLCFGDPGGEAVSWTKMIAALSVRVSMSVIMCLCRLSPASSTASAEREVTLYVAVGREGIMEGRDFIAPN